MLTLVTGTPGAGKTLNTIKEVMEKWGDSDRPIYYRGINELSPTLGWIEATDEQVYNWFEEIPQGSVVVVDEAYEIWGRRSHTSKEPDSVRKMAKHRHWGYDFYMICQKPTQLDHDVRSHANQHLHFERPTGHAAAKCYEWPKAADPQDQRERSRADTRVVRYDKKIYELYKSAEVHTFKPKLPRKLYFAVGAVVLTVGLFANFLYGLNAAPEEQEQFIKDHYGSGEVFDPDQYADIPSTKSQESIKLDESDDYLDQWKPRIPGLAHTAPVYDHLTTVKTYPRPQCIYNERTRKCRCYTQQGTPYDTSYKMCRELVADGWFNPFEGTNDTDTQPAGEGQRSGPPAASAFARI